jgi:hypothetical protein
MEEAMKKGIDIKYVTEVTSKIWMKLEFCQIPAFI